MRKGQATLELLFGYSIALIIITVTLVLLFTFFPGVFSGTTTPSSTGFAGLRVVAQGYLSNNNIFFFKFQNLLNENINVSRINMIYGGINQTASSCTRSFVPNLAIAECNFTISLASPFTATINVYYNPANTSIHPTIDIVGAVSG